MQLLLFAILAILINTHSSMTDAFGTIMTIYNTTGNSSYAKGQMTIDVETPLNTSQIEQKVLKGSPSPQNLSLSLGNETGIPTN